MLRVGWLARLEKGCIPNEMSAARSSAKAAEDSQVRQIAGERSVISEVAECADTVPCCAALQVTNESKREYVDLVAEHRMTTAIRAQTQSFLKGFWEMVPKVSSAALRRRRACRSRQAAMQVLACSMAQAAPLLWLPECSLEASHSKPTPQRSGMSCMHCSVGSTALGATSAIPLLLLLLSQSSAPSAGK